jgi:hypothetical protein
VLLFSHLVTKGVADDVFLDDKNNQDDEENSDNEDTDARKRPNNEITHSIIPPTS